MPPDPPRGTSCSFPEGTSLFHNTSPVTLHYSPATTILNENPAWVLGVTARFATNLVSRTGKIREWDKHSVQLSVVVGNVFRCINYSLLCVAFIKGEVISDFQSDQEISQVS